MKPKHAFISIPAILPLLITAMLSTTWAADSVLVYTNERLGVQIQVPQGWTYESSGEVTRQSLKQAQALAAKTLGMSEEEVAEIAKQGTPKEVLIKMNRKGVDLPLVQVISNDISTKPNVQSAVGELDQFINFVSRMTYIDIISPPSETEVNGKTGAHVSYQMEAVLGGQDYVTQSDVYFFLKGNHSIVVTAIRDMKSPNAAEDTAVIGQIIENFRI